MTAPTEAFDLASAKTIAAQLITNDQDTDVSFTETFNRIDDLHGRIFAALGDSADAIADKLAELGIKGALPEIVHDGGELYGDLVDNEGSALAVLLRDVCGADQAETHTMSALIVWKNDAGEELAHESVNLPTAIMEFMNRYEDFRYPALYTEPVPKEVLDFQNDTRTGIDRHEHTARGAVKQVNDRARFSQPMPDDLVAAIGAAGLTAEDYADQVLLFRDGQLWALVQGMDNGPLPGRGHWIGQYGCMMDLPVMEVYQGLASFNTRDDAVQYLLDNVDTPRMVKTQLPDGRWQTGPLTSGAPHKFMSDRTLVAALTAGVTLVQDGESSRSKVQVFRGDVQLATVSMIPGGSWQAELTDGQTLNHQNMDVMLTTTFEALTSR